MSEPQWMLGPPPAEARGEYEVILFGNLDICRLDGEGYWDAGEEGGLISDIQAYRGPLPSAEDLLLSLLRAQADRENDDE